MRKIVLVLIGCGVLLGGVGGWMVWQRKSLSWLNPLAPKSNVVKDKDGYVVVGFLPPWTIEKATIYPEVLDQLIFLGVEVNEKGDLVWDSQSNKMKSQRYVAMKEQMKKAEKENVIGIKLFEDKKIDALMASESAQINLIDQIKTVVREGNYDGVNVDFEYQGNAQAVLEDEFVGFLGRLRQEVGKEISIDVFANTVIKGDSQALGKMVETVDRVIVMAYDFHRPGMDYAGPVAPLQSEPGTRNIMEVVDRVVTLGLDKSKIIMAYPLYGYEWKTMSTDFASEARGGWGQMASYQRVQDLLKDEAFVKKATVGWDENSMTPYLSFNEDETAYKRVKVGKKYKSVAYTISVVHQIYYDDLRSLTAKFDLVKNSQMGGVGFWALGYEGEYEEVWSTLNRQLTKKN